MTKSLHVAMCNFLSAFEKRDTSMSVGAWAKSAVDLVDNHPDNQYVVDAHVAHLEQELKRIAQTPERTITNSGERLGPEWMLFEAKKVATEALSKSHDDFKQGRLGK